MSPRQFTEPLEVVLTDEEIKQKSEENNKRVLERARLKAEADRIGGSFRNKIKLLDIEIDTAAELIESGKEIRSIDCKWLPDVETREMRLVRLDTWDDIRRRPMDADERREHLQKNLWEVDSASPSPVEPESREQEETERVVVCANCGCPEKRHYSMGCEDCQCEDFAPKQNDDLAPPDILQSALALVIEREIPIATIETWTEEQRRQAQEWAIAAHAQANDNDVDVPPRPEFLVFDDEIAPMSPIYPDIGTGGPQSEEFLADPREQDNFTAPRCEECKMTDGGHAPTCSQSNRPTYEDYLAYATAHYKNNYNAHARKMELRRDPQTDTKVRDWIKETAPMAHDATA